MMTVETAAKLLNGDDEPPPNDRDMVARSLSQFDAQNRRIAELERGVSDAIVALRARDAENGELRVQLAERDNRLISIQASCDERVATIQAACDARVATLQVERDLLVTEAAELRMIFEQTRHLYQTIQLPLSLLPSRAAAIEPPSQSIQHESNE